MSTPSPSLQIGNFPVQYKLVKEVIDPRVIPICVTHLVDTGSFRKRLVYYHNFGKRILITIVTIPFVRGAPKIISYNYFVDESDGISLQYVT